MAINVQPGLMTVREYLEIEEQSDVKHEFYAGRMFGMAGGSPDHSLTAGNAIRVLGTRLAGSGCRVYTSDLRLSLQKVGLHTYADVVVACGERHYTEENPPALLNPTLIVEVLSPSTEAYDRGQKFEFYKTIDSLRAYLLIAQNRAHATLYSRQPDDRWIRDDFDGHNASVRIEALGIEIALAELYADVELPQDGPTLAREEE